MMRYYIDRIIDIFQSMQPDFTADREQWYIELGNVNDMELLTAVLECIRELPYADHPVCLEDILRCLRRLE